MTIQTSRLPPPRLPRPTAPLIPLVLDLMPLISSSSCKSPGLSRSHSHDSPVANSVSAWARMANPVIGEEVEDSNHVTPGGFTMTSISKPVLPPFSILMKVGDVPQHSVFFLSLMLTPSVPALELGIASESSLAHSRIQPSSLSAPSTFQEHEWKKAWPRIREVGR